MASQNVIERYLSATVTQGSAAAFVQGTFTTNIEPSTGYALKVTEVVGKMREGQSLLCGSNSATVSWSLSRDTKTAVGELNDTDIIYADGFHVWNITSGIATRNLAFSYRPVNGLMLVEPTVYFQLDSTATSSAITMDIRMYYEEVKLSEVEILRLLNNL